MEKTGTQNNLKLFCASILTRVLEITKDRQQKDTHHNEREKSLLDVAQLFRVAAQSADVPLIFSLEKLALGFEYEHLANSTSLSDRSRGTRLNTLDLAFSRLDDALSRDWAEVQNPEGYKERLKRANPYRQYKSPPKEDGFLTFIKAQTERLNKMQDMRTPAEIDFFYARQHALQVAKQSYVVKQCQALDLPIPQQGLNKNKEQALEL